MKYLSILSLLTIFFTFQFLLAQAPDTLWTKTFGVNGYDYGNSVQQTTDGGYIVTGWTEYFGTEQHDVWLIKTNDLGDTLWTKTFGSSGWDEGLHVQQTIDGGYIITGYTAFGVGYGDVWLIKTDALGDTIWTKNYGGLEAAGGSYVQQTTDSGYIITGYTECYGAGGRDIWLIKTDASGDTLWTKTFGGVNWDEGYSVQQTSDGGYIITGYTLSFGAGQYDLWLVKTDTSGDTIWTKTFGGSSTEFGYSVKETTNGGYIITGFTSSFGAGGHDVWLIRTDSSGDSIWTKTFGGIDFECGYSVQETSDYGFIITGYTESFGVGDRDIWLIKTDANGDTLWTKTIGRNSLDEAYSVKQTTDGGYIIAGKSSVGSFNYDVWLIKTAPDPSNIGQDNSFQIPGNYVLRQNYPNPFNPMTTIEFSLPFANFVTLQIYNILGEEVATLVSEKLTAGKYKYQWDAGKLASGVYLYRLEAGDFVDVKKMVLMK